MWLSPKLPPLFAAESFSVLKRLPKLEVNPLEITSLDGLHTYIQEYQNIFLFDEFKISDFIAPFFAASVAFLLGFYFYKKLISAVKDVL